MATPKKLPSGQWRTLAYEYTDESGKRHYRSFTDPEKKISALMAAEFTANKKRIAAGNLTVMEAIEEYINVKSPVLSPSTVRGYMAIKRNHFKDIENVYLKDLNNEIAQNWISGLSRRLAPKTVANANGLLSAVLSMFTSGIQLKTQLPAKVKTNLYAPSDNDVQTLLDYIQGTELEIAVLLAAFGPMRRGEICALSTDTILGNTVRVWYNMVKNANNQWVIKQPKSEKGYRDIVYPAFVIERLSGISGRVVHMNPDDITTNFGRTLNKIDIPHFRFHDLRHYAASIMHAIGIPDQYIMQRGGWSSDSVMKRVYRNTIDDQTKIMTSQINSHFENMQHKMQHDGS